MNREEDAAVAVARDRHAVTRDLNAPYEEHTLVDVQLPCGTFIRGGVDPILWHPQGHEGKQCVICGVVYDLTMTPESILAGGGVNGRS